MFSRKYFGIAGAAMMGTVALMGTNAANAVIDLDDGTGGLIYAQESLEAKVASTSSAYLLVGSMTSNNVDAKVGVIARPTDASATPPQVGDTLLVTFTLGDGLVFAGNTRPSLKIGTDTGSLIDRGGNNGGGNNSNRAIFTVTVADSAYSSESIAKLTIGNLGLPPNGSGSITMTVVNQTLKGDLLDSLTMNTASMSGAIKVMNALDENYMSDDVTAAVAEEFKKFEGSSTTAVLGYFSVGMRSGYLAAEDGLSSSIADIANLETSTITVTGDFSFADKVTLQVGEGEGKLSAPTDCSANNLLMTETVDGVMSNKNTVVDSPSGDRLYLCITVLGDEEIKAGSYEAVTKYTKATGKAFAAMGSEFSLGSIKRDGTTVQIPYLTTYVGYNHRLVLSNRGSRSAAYQMRFRPEMGITATEGPAAMGTLAAGETKTLKATDVVTLTDGSRTAATLTLVAAPGDIDVASVIVNKMGGGTDTVVLD